MADLTLPAGYSFVSIRTKKLHIQEHVGYELAQCGTWIGQEENYNFMGYHREPNGQDELIVCKRCWKITQAQIRRDIAWRAMQNRNRQREENIPHADISE